MSPGKRRGGHAPHPQPSSLPPRSEPESGAPACNTLFQILALTGLSLGAWAIIALLVAAI
jgi:hypothetical protein